jgi:predicted O-linked N-acetylglucosamine transferase (SPINDLY family)
MGNAFASRVAASLLNAIELPELITSTPQAYEALAIEIAKNPEKLAALKQKLASNRLTTPLFDTPQFTKDLERAYVQIYERYQDDLSPEHLFV